VGVALIVAFTDAIITIIIPIITIIGATTINGSETQPHLGAWRRPTLRAPSRGGQADDGRRQTAEVFKTSLRQRQP
jgi:hypothetical protein